MGLTGNLFQTVTCVDKELETLRRRRYGIIEVGHEGLRGIHLRPFPKIVSVLEARWAAKWKNRTGGDVGNERLLLYYNQPFLHPNFLALKYFVSDNTSNLATIAISLSVLDYIAKIKQTDAIVTEISNDRIRDRHLTHFGWEQHLPDSPRRNWIKRFYGTYPATFLFQEINRPSPAAIPRLTITPETPEYSTTY